MTFLIPVHRICLQKGISGQVESICDFAPPLTPAKQGTAVWKCSACSCQLRVCSPGPRSEWQYSETGPGDPWCEPFPALGNHNKASQSLKDKWGEQRVPEGSRERKEFGETSLCRVALIWDFNNAMEL